MDNQRKLIRELDGEVFLIPNYQRGYRWDEQQTRDLLNDILAFNDQGKKKDVYCLQPLVVSRKETVWRVVDGQQRLTTIFLLLRYIKNQSVKHELLSREKDLFSIMYERGSYSSDFLEDIENKKMEDALENVDCYHMFIVYETIREWFKERGGKVAIKRILNALLSDKVYFLWDEIEYSQENKTFTDLNSGRISLTDSELIKALFLNRNNYANHNDDDVEGIRQRIANEWHDIETALQNDEFWLFIHSRYYTKPTRIDFVLKLICENDLYNVIPIIGEEVYAKLNKKGKKDELFRRLGSRAYHNKEKYSSDAKADIEEKYKGRIGKVVFKYIGTNPERLEHLLKRKDNIENYNKNSDAGKKKWLGKYVEDKLRTNEAEFREKRLEEGTEGDTLYNELKGLRGEFIKELGKDVYERCKEETLKQWLGKDEFKKMMSDDHGLFRYFDEVFAAQRKADGGITVRWIEEKWKMIKDFFDVFLEWYNDYRLYHYIGYLVAVKGRGAESFIKECIELWSDGAASFENDNEIRIEEKDKDSFIEELKKEIVYKLKNDQNPQKDKNGSKDAYPGAKKRDFINDLIEKHNSGSLNTINGLEETDTGKDITDYLLAMNFDQKAEEGKSKKDEGYSKRCCVNILLLHSVETAIQYNDKLVNNSNYMLPYFTRFPFHLYNSDNWDVEHIRPGSGDALHKETDRLIYLLLAIQYFTKEELEKCELNGDITRETLNEAISVLYKPKKEISSLYDAIHYYINETNKVYSDDKNKRELDYYKLNDYIENTNDDEKIYYKKLEERETKQVFRLILKVLDSFRGEELPEDHKNRIYNFTLLDRSTNREYGNHIFPFKRAYIAEKEKGRKLRFYIEEQKTTKEDIRYTIKEVRDNKNKAVKILLAYYKTDDNDLKQQIKEYINSIISSKTFESSKPVDMDKVESVLKEKDPEYDPDKYSVVYLTSKQRKDELYYKLVKTPEEAPFVLDTTKNVFSKKYSNDITPMLHWTPDDANDYWKNMKEVLAYYFRALNDELDKKGAL